MALAYSARFRRCRAGLPGLGCSAAALSIVPSSQVRNSSTLAFSGLGIPKGGMAPVRSFLITFSHISALLGTLFRSAVSRVRPAILVFELWQVTQYLSSSARCVWAGKRPTVRMARETAGKTRIFRHFHHSFQHPGTGSNCGLSPYRTSINALQSNRNHADLTV